MPAPLQFPLASSKISIGAWDDAFFHLERKVLPMAEMEEFPEPNKEIN